MNRRNRSPWLHQLDPARPSEPLRADTSVDVAVIGAGIAGVATAFFALAKTGRSVLLIERARLAHGATGHNAGLVVADFERPLQDLEREFGLAATADAVRAIESGWALLDEMYTTAGLDIPLSRFVEATGLLTADHVALFVGEADFRRRAGLSFHRVKIAEGRLARDVAAALDPALYEWVPATAIDDALETKDPRYVGAAFEPGAVLNSALFCQEVVRHLQSAYPDRFRLVEETKVEKVVLGEGAVTLDCRSVTVTAGEVVLCTNGFEDFTIVAGNGLCLDKEFHRNVRGIVGYMSGYLEPMRRPPAGLVYLRSEGFSENEAYYYLTRRGYEYERGAGPRHNLLSVGGPQVRLEDHTDYSFDDEYPGERTAEIQGFVEDTFGAKAPKGAERVFAWHGLMGYTENMVRLVGPHPAEPRLLYNLGCNGIGILMSLYGGRTIARHLAGEEVPKTIFRPGGGSCEAG